METNNEPNTEEYIEPCYLIKLRNDAIELKQYRKALLKIELISDDAIHNDMITYLERYLRNKIEEIKNIMIEDVR